jgi:hypothetical protein
MANAWTGTNYVILEVSENINPDNPEYRVKIQRLPEINYIEPTYWIKGADEPNEDNLIQFPSNLNLGNFLTNALPQINTFLVSMDAKSYRILD